MEHLTQQVKEAFVDMRRHPYRLHAAFFHRGSAGGGHYWVYIFDHKKEVWRKYNDDRVSVVQNRNEIFGKPTQDGWGPPPNPYLLIYIRADRIHELAETVRRDIVYPPPDAPPPIPARSQMSEMPPAGLQSTGGQGGERGDVEMVEYVNGLGEQQQQQQAQQDKAGLSVSADSDHVVAHSLPHLQPPPVLPKNGDWDDSQLIADREIKW